MLLTNGNLGQVITAVAKHCHRLHSGALRRRHATALPPPPRRKMPAAVPFVAWQCSVRKLVSFLAQDSSPTAPWRSTPSPPPRRCRRHLAADCIICVRRLITLLHVHITTAQRGPLGTITAVHTM